MNKLFLLIATTVLFFSACKKEPQIVNNNTTIIYVNDTTDNGGTTPPTPTLFYDSSVITGASYNHSDSVGFEQIIGTIRELKNSELPFLAYGSNTVGCEMAIEFTFYSDRAGVTFDPDQSLKINFPNNQFVAKANNIVTVASGMDGSTKWWRLRAAVVVMRNINDTPLALSVTLEDFYYNVNNRPHALSINATTNGVLFLKKENSNPVVM